MKVHRERSRHVIPRRISVAATIALAMTGALVTAPSAGAVAGKPVVNTSRPETTREATPESAALAEAAESDKPVEVLAKRTETSQVFANPSGTFTEDRYALAQWTRQGNKLVDIDPTLRASADGRVTTKATTVGVTFSGGGTGPMAVVTRDGRSMSLSWPSPLPEPRLTEDTATYPDVLPGVDLKLRAGDTGFSQLLVVKSAEAAADPALKSLTFQLGTAGLRTSADEHGNLTAVDPAGQVVFTAPTPRMWDSSTAPAPASTPASTPAKPSARTTGAKTPAVQATQAEVAPPGGEFEPGHGATEAAMPLTVSPDRLTVTPDRSLLTGKDTTYPVYIDPAVSGARESWTIAYKKYPNSTFYNGAGWGGSGSSTSEARVGYENETNGLAESFFRMDSNNLWNTKKQVVKSTFRIKNTWSWSCTPRAVELWLTGSISASTSWNNRPAWKDELDSVNDSKGWGSSCPAGNLAFDVTSAAKTAATGKWPNVTLGMRASNESDVNAWKRFDAKSAVLSTEYNTLPNAPTSLDTIPSSGGCDQVAPWTTIGNTDITLSAKVSDADGGTVRAQFRMWGGNNTQGGAEIFNQIISASSGTVAKAKIPRALLDQYSAVAGGNFAWKVQTLDASAASTWVPDVGTCRFNFDPTRPSTVPDISSTDFPDGSDGWPTVTGEAREAGTFRLTNGGITDVTKYEYWTDWDLTVRTVTPKIANDPADLAEITITPPAAGSHGLYVRSLDGASNRSDRAMFFFYANSPATPDKAGDVNGDDIADLYGVRPDGELRLYPGQSNGWVAPFTVVSNADFTGASVTHRGDWTQDGFEDLVAAVPGDGGKTLQVFPNNGVGWACTARDEQADGQSRACQYDQQELDVYDDVDNHWTDADQILSIGDVDGPLDTDGDGTPDVPGHTDLLVKEGGLLWLYYGSDTFYLDETRPPVLLGDAWANYDLLAPGDRTGDGRVDLVARDRTNGDLRLFPGTGPNGEGLGSVPSSTLIGVGWTTTFRPLITAVPDAGLDGKADIWATGSDDQLYVYSNLSGHGVAVGSSGWLTFQSIT